MIARLHGTLIHTKEHEILLDVGGVGYRVFVSNETQTQLPEAGKDVSLWTHLAVRENALDLYGFHTEEELRFFELLIGVPGIGPKSGLATLSLASVSVLAKSIASGDITYLTKVSGIGKKNAQKIVLELKDKLGATHETGPDLQEETDAVEALSSLGYSVKESREALKRVPDEITGTSQRVKKALQLLDKAT